MNAAYIIRLNRGRDVHTYICAIRYDAELLVSALVAVHPGCSVELWQGRDLIANYI
jgi:hypothetical protein